MIAVCRDIEFNGDTSMWFYTEGGYVRHDSKGNVKGKITGENLPEPEELWKARCKEYGAAYPSDTIPHPKTGVEIRLRPTQALFELFAHWQGVQTCQH